MSEAGESGESSNSSAASLELGMSDYASCCARVLCGLRCRKMQDPQSLWQPNVLALIERLQ